MKEKLSVRLGDWLEDRGRNPMAALKRWSLPRPMISVNTFKKKIPSISLLKETLLLQNQGFKV